MIKIDRNGVSPFGMGHRATQVGRGDENSVWGALIVVVVAGWWWWWWVRVLGGVRVVEWVIEVGWGSVMGEP